MERAIGTLILVSWLLIPGAVRGQVYSGGDPEGATLTPFAQWDTNGPRPTGILWKNGLQACTSGPDYMVIAGYPYDGIRAVGASPYEGFAYEIPILGMYELSQDPLFDEDDVITALAATPARDAVYVAFQPIFPTASCLPILRVELDGTWAVAVTCDEIGAFEAGANRVRVLATAADGTLYAVVRYQDVGVEAVLRIDPAGEPMKRAERILSGNGLLPSSPDLTGDARLLQLAGLENGALAVVAQIGVVHEGWTEEGWVLLRRDADGTLTELTTRERIADLSGVNVDADLPAYSCLRGMLYDEQDKMLVCGGNGRVFLIDPSTPHHNHLLISSQWVMNAFSAWSGKPVYAPPGGAQGPGGCLGNVGWGDHRAYATFMGTFMLINWDEQLLDLDGDHALGFEEAARGTLPFVADNDGGGTCDGLEFVDFTDTDDPADDRGAAPPVMRWVSPGLWFGSRAGNSTESRHRIERYGVAAPDGSLLLLQDGTGDQLVRFTSWDEPLVPTGQTGTQGPMAAGPDGTVFRHQAGWGVLGSHPDGTDRAILDDNEIRDLAGTEGDVVVIDLAVRPDGAVLVGTRDGKLIQVDEDGAVELLYDAIADFAAAGLWDEDLGCFGGMACELSVGPIAYEPVHGMLLFWLTTDFIGSASFGFQLALVAVLPNGHMRVIADHWAFAEAMSLLGGLEPLDMEPDSSGGLWVLGAGGGGRRLLHLDGRCLDPVIGMALSQPMQAPMTTTGGLGFFSAWDLMVTPEGRLFTADAYFSNMSGLVPYGLVELAPLPDGIRAGDLLVVQPDEATLSRLLPDGGGELLQQGDPFLRPTAVAAAGGVVAVGDAGRGEILVSALDAQGHLGPWTVRAAVGGPTGMDIDGEGRILVVDGPGRRLLRVGTDGALEILAESDALGAPLDVVATASGAAVITDAETGRLLRVDKDGAVTTLADIPTPGAVALVAGEHYVVASSAGDTWPRTVGPGGVIRVTGAEDTSWDLAGNEPVGGVAAAPDGTIYLSMVKGWSWDWKDPFPTLRVFRITPAGYVQALVRTGLLVGGDAADVCRVRGPAEPLPAEPGDAPLPLPVDEGPGEAGAGGGGCDVGATGSAPSGLLLAVFLLAGLMVTRGRLRAPSSRTQRGISRFAAAATLFTALLATACGPGGSSGDPADALGADTWEPGTVAPECKGKDLCKPASPPVCVDGGAGSKRCVSDDDGCWIWSPVQPCPTETPCEAGICGGPWCAPACGTWQECGDDGCGGSCGTCAAPEICCGGFCGTCQADCTGRECGWDGAAGSCGVCPDGDVCVDGVCAPAGEAGCGEFLDDCDLRCEVWDQLCQEQCRAWLSPLGQGDVLAWEGCQLLHCAPCFEGEDEDPACLTACVQEHCVEEFASCYNRNGTETCADTWACAEACDPADQPCVDACTALATREAMIVLLGLVTCVEAVCLQDLPDTERLACEEQARTSSCGAQAAACFGPCEPICPTWATCGPDSCTGLCGLCPEDQLCNGFECI